VEATPARWSAEVAATKTMLTRTQESFGLTPETLAADAAYGSGLMLGWLMRRGIDRIFRSSTGSIKRRAISRAPILPSMQR